MNSTISAVKDEAEDMAAEAIKSVIQKSPHPTGADGRPSPYSTGEFVNNWSVGLDTSSDYTTTPIASKEAKISELLAKIKGHFITNNHLYIYNTGPYVAQVEYLGWKYSNEYAPIRRTVDELKAKGNK